MEEKEYVVTATITQVVLGTSEKDVEEWFENYFDSIRLGEIDHDITVKLNEVRNRR